MDSEEPPNVRVACSGDIDEVVRLKAKRKRLSTFGKALEDARAASVKAADTAAEILDAGDLTRADIAKVFALSKGERSTLIPAAQRRAVKKGHPLLKNLCHTALTGF